MKKILIFCIMGLMSAGVYAATMCVADDTLPIVLDPEIVGSSSGANNAEFHEWSAPFQYGTLFGVVACVSTSSGAVTGKLIDVDTGVVVTGGEVIGVHCWCQMTHPVKSGWVYHSSGGTTAYCGSVCAQRCSNSVASVTDFRKSMFRSVGN